MVNKKMKNLKFSYVVGFVAVACLAGLSWLYVSKNSLHEKNFDLHLYQTQIVESYKVKSMLVADILKTAKIKDQNIDGIILHISSWQALSLQDASQIEELNSYLDQHYSQHLTELSQQANKTKSLKEKMRQLLRLEEKINSDRHRIVAQR